MNLFNTTIQCPHCGHKKEEEMPERGSEQTYVCSKCAQTLQTPEGECCIYCAYGNIICPDQQDKRNCCSG